MDDARLRQRVAALGLLGVLGPSLTACGGGTGTAGASDTLYIGVAAAVAANTDVYFNGVGLALQHLNADRPGGTRPLGLRSPPADQPSQVAVAAYFRDDPHVIGVVGHTGSGQTMEAAPIYGDIERDGARALVAVSPTATNPAVAPASDWVFRVCPTDPDGARALAVFVADSLGAREAQVVYRNDLFGRGFLRTFRPAFQQMGGRVVERFPYLAGLTEYPAYAGVIARDGTPAVVFAGGAADALDLLRALRAAGAQPTILGTDDVAGLQGIGEAAGVRYLSFYQPGGVGTPAERRFLEAYRTQYGSEPDHRAALAYDAAMLIGRAAVAHGGDRRRIRDAVARTGREDPPFEGATGTVAFDANGDVVDKPIFVGEVRP